MSKEEQEIVTGILREVLEKMGVSAEIQTKVSEETLIFNLVSDDSGILIGSYGAHLEALQYLVRVLAHKKIPGQVVHFVVDVGGYKKSREDFLKELAIQASARVRETRETLFLKPMSSYERRVIHSEVGKLDDIVSLSEGEEPERRVVIRPKG